MARSVSLITVLKKDGNMNTRVLQRHIPAAVVHVLGLSSAENLSWTSGMSQLSQFSNH